MRKGACAQQTIEARQSDLAVKQTSCSQGRHAYSNLSVCTDSVILIACALCTIQWALGVPI